MSLRYVVVVQVDSEYHRVFGTYRDRGRAEAFASKVNDHVEKVEDREFEEWRKKNDGSMAPDGHGRAGVLIVHEPRVRRARRFALGELKA